MNRRTEEEFKFLTEYLECEIKYQEVSDGLDVYVIPTIGDVELPTYRVHFEDFDTDDESMQVKSDMSVGRLTSALKDVVTSGEASPLRDKLNQGFNNIRLHSTKSEKDKLIEDFQKKDFRANLNLVEMKFRNIEVEPNIEEQSLGLYFVDGNKGVKIADVDRNTNPVVVVNAFKEKVNHTVSSTFVTALRNQIREFKELFSEEVREDVANRRKKDLEKYGKSKKAK